MDTSYESCPRESNYSSAKFSNPGNYPNLWNKTPSKARQEKQENMYNKNSKPATPKKKISTQDNNNDKIIMSKKELMEFTKKFALNKVDYEEEIEFLKTDCKNKSNKIQVLENQIQDLRIQQDYLISVMEQLRDRHLNEINAMKNKYQCHAQMRQDEIDHLHQEIAKVRTWLDEEKVQTQKCMDFIKIKDEIIEKLEQEISKYKNQLRFSKDTKLSPIDMNNYQSLSNRCEDAVTQRPRINSNKKIIIRRDKKQGKRQNEENNEQRCIYYDDGSRKESQQIIKLTNIINCLRAQKIQIEDEKFQIFSKYREMTIENDYLRRAITKLEKQQQEQIKMKKSIHDLDQITKRIKDSQQGKQNLLVTKCLFLEKHVQKLAKQLSDVKSSHILSLSNLSSQPYSSESHIQLQP